MMKVPFSVIIGKSPMKTVWLLISPLSLFMNSAVTNSGAAYVMSLSLHSSTEALTSSKRGSVNVSDRLPAKSSIGDNSKCALFFVDLDQFKYVNDTCGHASGDHLLQLAAQQLRYAVRPEDFVARFGGDEFVVLLRNVSRGDAKIVAANVLEGVMVKHG